MNIQIYKQPRFFGFVRSVKVFINGAFSAKLKTGKWHKIEVNEGDEIRVSMDWCRSRPIIIGKSHVDGRFIVHTLPLLPAIFFSFIWPPIVLSLLEKE